MNPSPLIGRMRRRLTLEAPVEIPDGAGGVTRSFTTIAALWAQVSWEGGLERDRAARPEQVGRYLVTLRWRADVTAGMRFLDAGQVLEILSAGDPDGSRRRLVCRCQAIEA